MNLHSNCVALVCVAITLLAENVAATLKPNGKGNKVKAKESTFVPQQMIVGGENATRGRYPYQVGLLLDGFPYCGGTLIAPEWVLSAAHCAPVFSNVFQVDIGRYDRSNNTEIYETIDVDFFVLHPNYNNGTGQNDVLLIKLATPSKYSPVKLNADSTVPKDNSTVTVMGWGTTSSGGSGSDILLEVEIDVVSNEKCALDYDPSLISDDMLCASREGKDSCQGDSGGPLIIKGDNADSDVQVGIVSWGIGCAEPKYPGVYSRVSQAYKFIQDTMQCVSSNDNDLSNCESVDENNNEEDEENEDNNEEDEEDEENEDNNEEDEEDENNNEENEDNNEENENNNEEDEEDVGLSDVISSITTLVLFCFN